MKDAIVVHVAIFTFNFLASVIQGITGFGDTVVLHICWYTASVANPDVFLHTALGDSPVYAVVLLMYVRIIFSTPLLAYWSLKDGIFSWQMTIAMAVPSTLCAIGGYFVASSMKNKDDLKGILGISSLIFAGLYLVILAAKYLMRQKKIRALMEKAGVRKRRASAHMGDTAAVTAASGAGRTSMGTTLDVAKLGDTAGVSFEKDTVASAAHTSSARVVDNGKGTRSTQASEVVILPEVELVEQVLSITRNNSRVTSPVTSAINMKGGPVRYSVDSSKSVEEDVGGRQRWGGDPQGRRDRTDAGSEDEEAFISTVTGSPFTRNEAEEVVVNEPGASVPPLTPSKLSPTSTLTYTRVRVNRNLDANGKIKLSTTIGASVAAALSGYMGSITGVGAPPQIIFILLFDVPQYIIRVNFCMQSIPSAAVRFILACVLRQFQPDMIPIFVNALAAGYCGIFTGTKLGKLLGPKTYSIFVLSILLLSSLIMITTSAALLSASTALCTAVCVGLGWLEKRREVAATVAAQRAMEEEIARSARPPETACTPTHAAPHSGGESQKQSAVPALEPARMQTTRSPRIVVPVPSSSTTTTTAGAGGARGLAGLDAPSGSSFSLLRGDSAGPSPTRRVRRAELNRPPSLFSTPTSTTVGVGASSFASAATGVGAASGGHGSPRGSAGVRPGPPQERMQDEADRLAERTAPGEDGDLPLSGAMVSV